jgi:hypothetical protein
MPRYFTFSGHIGVWAGGPGGTGPPKVLRSGKNPCVRIRENIKISEKLCYVRKTFVCVRKLRDIRGNFFGMSGKFFGDLPPPPPPQTRLGPYAHVSASIWEALEEKKLKGFTSKCIQHYCFKLFQCVFCTLHCRHAWSHVTNTCVVLRF